MTVREHTEHYHLRILPKPFRAIAPLACFARVVAGLARGACLPEWRSSVAEDLA